MAESDDDVLAALILDVAELQTAVEGLHVRLREAVAGLSALGDLTTLADRVAHLEEAFGSVAARLEDLPSERKAKRVRVWSWPDLNAQEAVQAWAALSDWMRDVLLPRYPDVERILYPCWYRHPKVLDALTALYAAWVAAYRNPTASPSDAAAWLNTWLPAMLGHMKDDLVLCNRHQHHRPLAQSQDVEKLFSQDLKVFVDQDVAGRASPPKSNQAPGISAQE